MNQKSFKERLKEQLKGKLGTIVREIRIKEDIPNIISVYADNSKFELDIIDGMYVAADNDYTDEFDYYVGDEVNDKNGTTTIEFQGTNPKCNWNLIRTVDNTIDFIYKNEIINTMKRHSITYALAQKKKSEGPSTNQLITKKTIDFIKETYEEKLTSLMRLKNSADKVEYNVVVHPNYIDRQSVIIYTQIGYPDSGYSLDRDNRNFFLVINPHELTCEYGTDFPWVAPTVNLFSMVPGVIDESKDFKSALQIIADELLCKISDIGTDELNNNFYTDNPANSHLRTSDEKVKQFVQFLYEDIVRNYPPINVTDCNIIEYDNKDDGITRISLGSIIIDVAIGSCGTVDIALDHEITQKETWDDILYTKKEISLKSNQTLSELGFLSYSDCSGIESKTIMEDIGNIIMAIMYQAMKGEDDIE